MVLGTGCRFQSLSELGEKLTREWSRPRRLRLSPPNCGPSQLAEPGRRPADSWEVGRGAATGGGEEAAWSRQDICVEAAFVSGFVLGL